MRVVAHSPRGKHPENVIGSHIVCINSTVPVRRRMRHDGRITPLHYWGYAPGPNDVLLAHRINRVEITLRYKLGGLDPDVLLRTCWHLARGAAGVFVVTQPDIWQALPLLRRLFPRQRLVCWVWMDWEVDRYLNRLRVCDHVICATEGAKTRLDAAGMANRASFEIWGCDPQHYRLSLALPVDRDVIMVGLTNRDEAIMNAAIALNRYSIRATIATVKAIGAVTGNDARIEVMRIETETDLVTAFHRSRVTWIPLKADEPYLSGITNVIESLLCGTAVVIGDTSRISEEVLRLPGVFRYRTGSLADFVRATDAALEYMRQSEARSDIAKAASQVLNGIRLGQTIRRSLGFAESTSTACAS